MQSGNVGKMASNQIPTTANAVLDLRLVLAMTGKATTKVIDHVIEQGYFVTNEEPTNEERIFKIIKIVTNENGLNAQRTSMDLPIIKSHSGSSSDNQ
jgi:hypothetical protein